jgi:putative endonuclease
MGMNGMVFGCSASVSGAWCLLELTIVRWFSANINLTYMKLMFVYMLKCADGTYYTGVTNNVDRRFNEHQSGSDGKSYTFGRRPLELVYTQTFLGSAQAIEFEKRLKKWSKTKKEALINGEFNELPALSKKKFN